MAGVVDSIAKWQQAVRQEHAEVEPSPLLQNVFKACSELYSAILDDLRQQKSIEQPTLISLERGHSYLLLWADGYGVTDGSIETSLEKSKRATQATFRLLISISRVLTNKLLPVLTEESQASLATKATELTRAAGRLKFLTQKTTSRVDESDTDSESESDSVYGVDDLQEVAEDLRTDTQCLLDLGSRFDEPALGMTSNEDATQLADSHTWDPTLNFVERIQWRYPQCDQQLSVRLGKINWARVVKSQEDRGRNQQERLQEAWSSVPDNPGIAAMAKPLSSRGASTTMHDSGIGTSLPSNPSLPPATQYAETIVSYHAGHGGSVRIPPLPEAAKHGVPFECMACGRLVTIQTNSLWKRHLFEDLRPYLCLDSTCNLNESTFPTKAQWETHFTLDHANADDCPGIVCPICQTMTPSGRIHVMTHLAKHMEEIALTVLPTNADSEDGTDVDSGLASDSSSSSRSDVFVPPEQKHQSTSKVPPEMNEERADQSNHPTTFQCSHCHKKFTRAYNLRSHLRTHTEERSFVCAVCGKAFAWQHDRERHESLHSGKKEFVCKGDLNAGGQWGCGRRFASAEALDRHLRSEAGQICKLPQVDDSKQPGYVLQDQVMVQEQTLPDEFGTPSDFAFPPPSHILAQYTTLAGVDWPTESTGMLGGDSEITLCELDAEFFEFPSGKGYESPPFMSIFQEEHYRDKAAVTASSTNDLDKAKEDEEDAISGILRQKETSVLSADDITLKECKEPGCNKKFRRACDLTKHERTHTRPWKCPIPTCKYHEYGWGTEKEMDRHVNDKHSAAPAMYKCLFPPCPYKSKRESNCKQHMEKAHGWNYVRTKTNGQKKVTYSSEEWSALKGLQDSTKDNQSTTDVDSGFLDETKPPEKEVETSSIKASHNTQSAPIVTDTTLPALTSRATNKICDLVLRPILAKPEFKPFHPLVVDCPRRIKEKEILCLRDLEKTLLLSAPEHARTPTLYMDFCLTTVRVVQATVEHLDLGEQTRPRDLPYTNGYFIDLVDQIQLYAKQLRDSKDKQNTGDVNIDPSDEIKLHGGIHINGRPAVLVRVTKNGKAICLATGEEIDMDEDNKGNIKPERSQSEELAEEDEIMRSMARRKKNASPDDHALKKCREPGCNKLFKRPCDLTKHEKTHSRPSEMRERELVDEKGDQAHHTDT